MIKLSYKTAFYFIILIALAVRIYFVFFTGFGWYECDSETYLKMGQAILDGKPISYFPNGYPLLVALVLLTSGMSAPAVLVIINIFAQIISLFIAERILNYLNLAEGIKLIAVTLLTFYPDQLSRVRFIMTEPLTVLFILLSIYLLFSKKNFWSGFFAYISILYRPSLILFVPIVIIYQFYKNNKSASAKISLGVAAAALLFYILDLSGITAPQNNLTQNILVSIQSYGYKINHSLNTFTNDQIAHPIRTYFNYAIANPSDFLNQRLLSFWSLWGPYVPSELGIGAMILHGLRFPFFILAFLTFVFRKYHTNNCRYIFVLFTPVISITLIQMLFFSTQRHQFAAEPFVILLSVIGTSFWLNKLLHQNN